MIALQYIPKESVNDIWDKIEDWVESALGVDESYTPDDIRQLCAAGEMDLRLIYSDKLKGFLISSIFDTPNAKVCYAPWLGGEDLGEWVKPGFELFKEYLKESDCKQFSFIGRKAWHRLISADYEGVFYLIKL